MWKVTVQEDPLCRHQGHSQWLQDSSLLTASCSIQELFDDDQVVQALLSSSSSSSSRCGPVALADYVSRCLIQADQEDRLLAMTTNLYTVQVQPLERLTLSSSSSTFRRDNINSSKRKKNRHHTSSLTPYMLERSDVTCSNDFVLTLRLRVCLLGPDETTPTNYDPSWSPPQWIPAVQSLLQTWQSSHWNTTALLSHVTVAVLQDCLRTLVQQEGGVAFVANQAILPRKSGASQAPMASPPAVPFVAPADSCMCRTLVVPNLPPLLHAYLPRHLQTNGNDDDPTTTMTVSLTGLFIPKGVSLIVGGGYHGKSTLLRTIAAGVYNKIPKDGREFCVTVESALTVRAEDGRYVNNCNVGAFISNLPRAPTPPPQQDQPNGSLQRQSTPPLDTHHFSTAEASGSTSQAANVVEALELGAQAFLVDEDVSAANFMARDGRMRALVMDESITPLLYRVNGLFHTHGVSSIVVVGGVGDWLDVPNQVILMQNYKCLDATAKARSISQQFSHGHVQYGGRGVVHRLEWNADQHTPLARRPTQSSAQTLLDHGPEIGLLDGGTGLVFHTTKLQQDDMTDDNEEDEEEDRFIDMSRMEQLLGKKPQLFACGLAALWVLAASQKNTQLGLSQLLDLLDREMDQHGMGTVLLGGGTDLTVSPHQQQLMLETLGHVYRPRRLEVGQAICRLRGVCFEDIPAQVDPAKLQAMAEEERKKKELMDLWNSRRKNKLVNGES